MIETKETARTEVQSPLENTLPGMAAQEGAVAQKGAETVIQDDTAMQQEPTQPAQASQETGRSKKAEKAAKKRAKKEHGYLLNYSTGVKTIVFVGFLLMCTLASLCVLSIGMMLDNGFYTSNEFTIKEEQFSSMTSSYLPQVVEAVLQDDSYKALDALCAEKGIVVTVLDAQGNELLSNATKTAYDWSFTYQGSSSVNAVYANAQGALATALREPGASIVLSFTPDGWANEISTVNQLIEIGYANRYFTVLNALLAVGIGLLCFFTLFASAGRSPRGGQVVLRGWTSIPLDLFTLYSLIAFTVPFLVWDSVEDQSNRLAQWHLAVVVGLTALALVSIALLYLLNIAARCKKGGIWRNTVVFELCGCLWRMVKTVAHWLGSHCAVLFGQLPFIWKGVAILPGMVLLNVLVLWVCIVPLNWNGAIYAFFTAIQAVALAAGYLYVLLVLNRLAEGGKALASGDLEYQVDTDKLYFEFKEHAENINRMGGCLTQAVNEQLKSERMKTELITNVSHDIKTPLTSIINYADLLSKEETDNETIVEYTAVIARQSERLKRLIEDLVEASKASTGNLEVSLVQCDVGVMLSQVTGEYQQRLEEQFVTLVTKQPEEKLYILVDGRHLWRIFDNLLGNIYKYTQQGTRVYLTLEKQDDTAVLTFKNISKYPLDISAEELMERFVRGDASRHNEGNGLGLSITQSLTELQGGSLSLHIDGDLFKVALSFPLTHPGGEIYV